MEVLLNPDEKIICPYNSSHHIIRKRMNTHLVKCKKSYPEAKLADCEFNLTHKIPEPELQYHHENCPDRKKMEERIYQEEGQPLNNYPIFNKQVEHNEGDSWDNANYAPIKIAENIEKRGVIRGVDVASAAKRKDFRHAERKRLAQLDNNSINSHPGPSRQTPAREPISTLPEVPELSQSKVQVISEDTPNSISDLMHRIKIGGKKSFIPKSSDAK